MKTLRLVAATALVSSVFALSASAAEKEWWNVDFTSPTPNGVQLNVSELGALTNDASTMAAGTVQPYTNGVWSAVDSDESYVTNEFNPSGSFGGSNCLRLDTQGNDLTWTPDENLASNGVQTLVDADLYLVGSDSAPTDFDANNDVQAAIYLKNETDNDIFFMGQVSPVGVEFGSKVRGFVEAGFGEQGIVLAGLKYKF